MNILTESRLNKITKLISIITDEIIEGVEEFLTNSEISRYPNNKDNLQINLKQFTEQLKNDILNKVYTEIDWIETTYSKEHEEQRLAAERAHAEFLKTPEGKKQAKLEAIQLEAIKQELPAIKFTTQELPKGE